MNTISRYCTLFGLAALVFLGSCDEDPPLPDNRVEFESDALGMSPDEETIPLSIRLSREASVDAEITLEATLTAITYGVEFETQPAMEGNILVLPVTKGQTEVTVEVVKKEGVLLDGDEQILFAITGAGSDLVIGERKELLLSFSEILAEEGVMDPNVGGQSQPNVVFVDLSANRQTTVVRSGWDLGFYTADGEFRVVLNASASMMARALNKTDLNAVTAADTTGWGAQLSTDAVFAAITSGGAPPAWVSEATRWIDDPSGDMSGTAIAEVSASADNNRVYIINRGKNPDGSPRGWKKIRVLRNGDGYTLQHADIGATTFASVEVTRDNTYLFNYIHFETGPVAVEPQKDRWDIAFTVFTNTAAFGPGLTVPYVYNDIVIQNRYETGTAELLTATAGSYDAFGEDDLANVTFESNQLTIGANWRSGGGPGAGPALKDDRFYVIKDADGNVYKLKFTALTQNGERGRPQFQFALIKKGEG